ncbi:hypothetical protein JCM10213_006067 [Rhodosporidiobolus nylandii]
MWALRSALHPAKRRRLNPLLPLASPPPSASPAVQPRLGSAGLIAGSLRAEVRTYAARAALQAAEHRGEGAWSTGIGSGGALARAGRGPVRAFSTSSPRPSSSLSEPEPPQTPLNEAQVPLISPHLRAQLFPSASSSFAPPPPSPEAVKLSVDHLRHHQLLPDPSSAAAKKPPPAVEFDLPRLQGPSITHHFHALGRDVAEPYLSMARSFAKAELPPMPAKERWVLSPGWTYYSPDGSSEPVDYPPVSDETMVFDVETMPYAGGAWPVMAVAVGKSGWYAWSSPWLTGDDDRPNHLIPFGPPSPSSPAASDFRSRSELFERADERPRLVIGHNILYDRARIAQEYNLRRPSTRYLDTLSLHVAISGLTNPQRPTWLKYRKDREAEEEAELAEEDGETVSDESEGDADVHAILAKARERKKGKKTVKVKDWKDVASVNSLAEVARLHCGIKVDKTLRNVFIDPAITIEDVREHFVDLINYCARDVDTTLAVYRSVFPKFLESCPHPATFAGVTLMSQPVLPVDRKWPEYLERAESVYQDRLAGVVSALTKLAEDARAQFDKRGDDGRFVWEDDLWLRQLDWSPKRARRLPGDVPAQRRTAKQMDQAAFELAKRQAERGAELEAEKAASQAGAQVPAWTKALDKLTLQSPLLPLLLETSWRGYSVVFTHSHGWLFAVPQPKRRAKKDAFVPEEGEDLVHPSELGPKDAAVATLPSVALYTLRVRRGNAQTRTLVSTSLAKKARSGQLSSPYSEYLEAVESATADKSASASDRIIQKVKELAAQAVDLEEKKRTKNVWLSQLDWTPVDAEPKKAASKQKKTVSLPTPSSSGELGYSAEDLVWPKWYYDLDTPGQGLDVSIGKRAAPLLLKLKWKGFPVAYSKQHGWLYRIPLKEFGAVVETDSALKPLAFTDPADAGLDEDDGAAYVKLPHPDGEGKNVGSPLSKPFVAAFEDGILTSEYPAAEAALSLNASCSYWTSARERITNQMVVWEGAAKTPVPTPAAIAAGEADEATRGLILPQVLPMGTITRRSVERTWLTASNAKKNRVGSELKSMIRAPPGYAIVGADVDSEELWICSVMGDAQFGIHGATAIGWMTLEGTKSAGTDMHSKTASILGISRDDAKVFNYSRIYGAGVKHAVVLLLKANPGLSTEEATSMAQKLYSSTKGLVDRSAAFKRNFWHGGTESFVFNKLEEIAKSDRPRTPALGCGLTAALSKANLPADGKSKAGEGYLPSRINWVVQSSGVDYLHLLLVSMEYLTKRFEIDARYLISVHDEVRYLVKEEDKYRAAMALQVANLWTRSLFAYRLQMPDLPQGCAFFSAVDIDSCFRKEVNMSCTTPSNPDPIPFGESLDILDSLAKTPRGSLFPDGRSMVEHEPALPTLPPPSDLSLEDVQGDQHRVADTSFLLAQMAKSQAEVTRLWRESQDKTRWQKLGLDAGKMAAKVAASRRKTPSSSSTSTAEAVTARKRKTLRYDDDAELLPLAPKSPAAAAAAKPAPRPATADAEEDDEDGWDEPDQDDYLESLLPDDVKRRFSLHVPASRAQV